MRSGRTIGKAIGNIQPLPIPLAGILDPAKSWNVLTFQPAAVAATHHFG